MNGGEIRGPPALNARGATLVELGANLGGKLGGNLGVAPPWLLFLGRRVAVKLGVHRLSTQGRKGPARGATLGELGANLGGKLGGNLGGKLGGCELGLIRGWPTCGLLNESVKWSERTNRKEGREWEERRGKNKG